MRWRTSCLPSQGFQTPPLAEDGHDRGCPLTAAGSTICSTVLFSPWPWQIPDGAHQRPTARRNNPASALRPRPVPPHTPPTAFSSHDEAIKRSNAPASALYASLSMHGLVYIACNVPVSCVNADVQHDDSACLELSQVGAEGVMGAP